MAPFCTIFSVYNITGMIFNGSIAQCRVQLWCKIVSGIVAQVCSDEGEWVGEKREENEDWRATR